MNTKDTPVTWAVLSLEAPFQEPSAKAWFYYITFFIIQQTEIQNLSGLGILLKTWLAQR